MNITEVSQGHLASVLMWKGQGFKECKMADHLEVIEFVKELRIKDGAEMHRWAAMWMLAMLEEDINPYKKTIAVINDVWPEFPPMKANVIQRPVIVETHEGTNITRA